MAVPSSAIKKLKTRSRDNTQVALVILLAYGIFKDDEIDKAIATVNSKDTWVAPSNLPMYTDDIENDLVMGKDTPEIQEIRKIIAEHYGIALPGEKKIPKVVTPKKPLVENFSEKEKNQSNPPKRSTATKTIQIHESVPGILGIENIENFTYEDYYDLLVEKLALVSLGESDLSTEEVMILQEEVKKIKPLYNKNPEEKIKVRTRKISKEKLFGKKPKVSNGALVRTKSLRIPKNNQTNSDSVENLDSKENSNILSSILESLTNITNILTNQIKFDKKLSEKSRREKEFNQRKEKENLLESSFSKGIEALTNTAKKIFDPFQDILKRLLTFFTWIFLGSLFQKFMKWANNPENEGKVKILGDLLRTFWPAILGALVLFTTPFGKFIRSITSKIIKWTFKLTKGAIPALTKFVMKNPVTAAVIGTGAAIAGATVLGKSKEDQNRDRILQQEAKSEGKSLDQKKKEVEKNKSWFDRFGDAFNVGQLGMGGINPLSFARGGVIPLEDHGYNGIDSDTGEKISGAGRDTQLIAARPGEVVLTPEDQSYIFQRTGFDIPGFVGKRKPKFVNGSNIKFADSNLGNIGKLPTFNAGGIVGGNSSAINLSLSDTQRKALDILGKYESKSSGGYNAVNQIGTSGGRGVSGFAGDFTKMQQHKGVHLTNLTVKQIMDLQHDDKTLNDEEWIKRGKLHAVGRYQIVGNTLPELVEKLQLSPDTKFTPAVQDAMALQLLKERGIQPWVGPSDKATPAEKAIVENARGENIKISKVNNKKSSGKVLSSRKIGDNTYTEREGGVYTRNGVPISRQQYTAQAKPKASNPFASLVGRPAEARTITKTNQQKLVEQRPWWDKLGWFGGASRTKRKKGGGYIGESSGIHLPGMTDDRELVAVQPGEYILSWDAVRKMGGKHGVDKIVEKLDSNSNAALDGKILNPISKDFGIKPYNTSLNLSSMMSKNMSKGSMIPGSSGSGGKTEVPQEFHSPICPFASGHRETIFQVLGIIA